MFESMLTKAVEPLTPEQERLPYGKIPDNYHITAFGVPYIRNPDGDGGFLYVTRWGWHRMAHLTPRHWYEDRAFVKHGTRLRGSTGTVYYFDSLPEGSGRMELLIKVSRLAEEVPGKLGEDIPGLRELNEANFNSPFEEFGLVEELRASRFGPPGLHIRTKRPLAIYCAPRDLPAWQLGRKKSEFTHRWKLLDHDQEMTPEGMRIHLLENRQYFLIYAWVPGLDAQEALEKGLLSESEIERLSERVNRELAEKGFRILDNKPKHFILRQDQRGNLIRHHGELMYVQVDFELLQRTSPYQRHLAEQQEHSLRQYLNEYSSL